MNENENQLWQLDRDTPGIFQVWEFDMEEITLYEEGLMNVGSCEQEQLEVMDVPNMRTLAEIIQKMYADLIQSGKDTKYTYTHALEPDDDGFANLITFDCRQYLKPEYIK